MKKGIIILSLVSVLLVALSITEYVMWNNDKTYYEAQLNEYETAFDSLNKSLGGKTANLSDANKSIADLKGEIAQLQSDLDAYKKAIDEVNAERKALNEEAEAKTKADEELWNSLTDVQKDAITRGREKAKVTNYLLLNNTEYAEIYAYMRDLSDKGLVELSKSEYKKYKEAKTRMNELEAEAKALLESDGD